MRVMIKARVVTRTDNGNEVREVKTKERLHKTEGARQDGTRFGRGFTIVTTNVYGWKRKRRMNRSRIHDGL